MSALRTQPWPRQSELFRCEEGDRHVVLNRYWPSGRVCIVSFELLEATSVYSDGEPCFDDAVLIATGSVKWDGCMQIEIPPPGFHMCTKEDIDRLRDRLQWAREQCAHAMPGTDIEKDYR